MVRSEAGGLGVSAVLVTGRFIFVGGKEEGSGGIRRRGGNSQGGGNAPGNDYRTGVRAGVQSSNLSY